MPAILTMEANMRAMIINDASQLPEELHQALNLRSGQAVALIPVEGTMRIVPVPTLDELRGIAEGADTDGYRDRQGS